MRIWIRHASVLGVWYCDSTINLSNMTRAHRPPCDKRQQPVQFWNQCHCTLRLTIFTALLLFLHSRLFTFTFFLLLLLLCFFFLKNIFYLFIYFAMRWCVHKSKLIDVSVMQTKIINKINLPQPSSYWWPVFYRHELIHDEYSLGTCAIFIRKIIRKY